jgi:hypothetical protein
MKPIFQDEAFERTIESSGDYEIIRDCHYRSGAEIAYLKIAACSGTANFTYYLCSSLHLKKKSIDKRVGTVVHGVENEKSVTVWIPRKPEFYFFDANNRIRRDEDRIIETIWDFNSHIQVSISGNFSKNGSILLPFVKLDDPQLSFFNQISVLSDNELRTYKRSDWFFASSIGSLWDYLIHGSLYDPRVNDTNGSRFKCQQCAFAWWKYLQGNLSVTAKEIYSLLRNEIAYSILLDMDDDGGWRHGYWSDDMETHSRFHLDGLELFLSQYNLKPKNLWLERTRRGMSFIFNNLTDNLDNGMLWFLHDTIEAEKHHHFRTTLFGKDPGNSLCINTHSHALRVLYLLHKISPDDDRYISAYNRGMEALRKLLQYQPADFLYRPLMKRVLNTKVVVNRSRVFRKFDSLIVHYFQRPLYWKLMQKYPRLVHPNGFIERDLTLSYASDRYHITNIKEMLKLYAFEKPEWLKSYIIDGFDFIRYYVRKKGIRNVVRSSPYYIEIIDILALYSQLIEEIPRAYIETIRQGIFEETGGYSIEDGEYRNNESQRQNVYH